MKQASLSGIEIRARRIKASLSDDGAFYWFYVAIYLAQSDNADLSLDEISLVEYHLDHEDFADNPDRRVKNTNNQFEYRLWLYGFIMVSADVVTKDGEVLKIKSTPISWPATAGEKALNGADELTW